MSVALDDIRAKAGDSISEKWPKLIAFLEWLFSMLGQMQGQGLLKDQTAEGFAFMGVPPPAAVFRGSFWVALSGNEITVGAGRVEKVTPRIAGKLITGDDGSGRINTASIPRLKIDGNEKLRSRVCLRAKLEGGADTPVRSAMLNPDDPEALTIVHVPVDDDPDEENVIFKTIAVVIWRDQRTPERVEQVVYFDQRLIAEGDNIILDEAA